MNGKQGETGRGEEFVYTDLYNHAILVEPFSKRPVTLSLLTQ